MARAPEDLQWKLAVAIAILSVSLCLRVGGSASIPGIDCNLKNLVSFSDRQVRRTRVTRPGSNYIPGLLLGFIRATLLALDRRPSLPFVKGRGRKPSSELGYHPCGHRVPSPPLACLALYRGHVAWRKT